MILPQLLYGLVHNSDDAISLQSDLNKLAEWAKLWQVAFNPSKCHLQRVCRTKCPFIHSNTRLDHTLQVVDHYPYLGVSLSEDLNWKPHILSITNKANSTLGFVKRNLHHSQGRLKIRPTNGNMVVLCGIRIEHIRNHGSNRSSAGQHSS